MNELGISNRSIKENNMFCKNCGKKVFDDTLFCHKCKSEVNFDNVEQRQEESFIEIVNSETARTQEQSKEFVEQVDACSLTSSENGVKKKKRFKRAIFILGILALIFVIVILVDEVFFRRGNSDIASVAAHKQFLNSQGLKGNYEDVIGKYLVSPKLEGKSIRQCGLCGYQWYSKRNES